MNHMPEEKKKKATETSYERNQMLNLTKNLK